MLRKLRDSLRLLWDIILLPVVVLRIFWNPDNVDPIFQIAAFRSHGSFLLARQKILADSGMAAMVQERYLAKEKYDLEHLRTLPDGTLGREYARFMDHFRLDPGFFKPPRDPYDDDVVYVSRRCPPTHDIWHLVVGIAPAPLGEMKLSAFYVAQIRSPFNALFLGIGLFVSLIKMPELLEDYFDGVTEGWTLGKKARPLFAMKWEHHWERPLVEIRRELNIPEVPTGVASISLMPAAKPPLQGSKVAAG